MGERIVRSLTRICIGLDPRNSTCAEEAYVVVQKERRKHMCPVVECIPFSSFRMPPPSTLRNHVKNSVCNHNRAWPSQWALPSIGFLQRVCWCFCVGLLKFRTAMHHKLWNGCGHGMGGREETILCLLPEGTSVCASDALKAQNSVAVCLVPLPCLPLDMHVHFCERVWSN